MQEIMQSEMKPNQPKSSCVKIEGYYFNAPSMHEIFAFMGEHDIVLSLVHGKKNKSFAMSAEAMDSLASAWFAFRSECKYIEEEEAVRVKRVEAEALAYTNDELTIECSVDWEHTVTWTVSAPKVSIHRIHITTADSLLAIAQQAKADLDEYHATIAQAKAIVNAHSEHLKVGAQTWNDGSKHWRIMAEYGEWKRLPRVADSATRLLVEVQEALEELQERVAFDQAYAAATNIPTPAPAD